MAHIQDALPLQVHQHIPVPSEQPLNDCPLNPPLVHTDVALPQLIPVQPQTKLPGKTSTVFLEYAPGLPGSPAPQQHMLAPLPEAPQISMIAVPHPGEFQQKHWDSFKKLVLPCLPGVKK
jgi:hypothetical protein